MRIPRCIVILSDLDARRRGKMLVKKSFNTFLILVYGYTQAEKLSNDLLYIIM